VKLFALIAVALLLPQEKNEAEELYKKMEAKILEAKTIQVKVKGSMEDGKIGLAADILLGESNRARLDVEMQIQGSIRTFGSVSDGKSIQVTATDGTRQAAYATPETFGVLFRRGIAIVGAMHASSAFSGRMATSDPATAYKVSDFVLGPKGKVGETEAQMVQYKVATKYDTNITVMVWIDPKTHLPLKRTVTAAMKSGEETYSEVKLDEKIDAAKFELPKEGK